MGDTPLDIAFWNYDRTRALMDGSVKIPGVEAKYHTARIVPEIFRSMIKDKAYDVSEMGWTHFLRNFEASLNDSPPFLAIPVFPNRAFRHSGIYINTHSNICSPSDLNGKRIGELALYSHDAGIMSKGALMDSYGFKPETCTWVVGSIDFPMKTVDFVPHKYPPGVDITLAPEEVDLGDLLESGEIDALFSADIPECVLAGSPNVARLFPDYQSVEAEYYRDTGVFPIMHTIVVRQELADSKPEVVKAVYKGFCDAKEKTKEGLVHGLTFNNMAMMVPWLSKLVNENRKLMGEDWWPYGLGANEKAIDAVLRYHYEQGITKRRFTAKDVFVPYLLDT